MRKSSLSLLFGVFDVHSNENTFIPIFVKHRLANPGTITLQIIEVQNGDYVEEDDIDSMTNIKE